MATVVFGDYEWDDEKAMANMRKHRISFEEATTVFQDIDYLVNRDPMSSERFIAVGFSVKRAFSSSFTLHREHARGSSPPVVLQFPRRNSMPTDADLEIPELSPDWFASAAKPNRRGTKRAVFVEEAIARRFDSDDEIEQALRALLEAAAHVRKAG